MQDLRNLIREVLAEELAGLKTGEGHRPAVTEERVAIRSDAELAAFVRRLLRLAQDGQKRSDLEAGRYVFRLANGADAAHPGAGTSTAGRPGLVRFETGLMTEKDVARLPEGLASLSLGPNVRLTPLARDELRRRGISIERTKP